MTFIIGEKAGTLESFADIGIPVAAVASAGGGNDA